jgi:hypothetical protein
MRRLVLSFAVLASSAAAIAACVSTSVGIVDPLEGGTADSSTGDGGGCPQFDLQTDPKHCGSCTNVCAATQVCSAGKCKGSCDAPLIKCAGDSGSCVDVTKDPKNCGSCGNACPLPDGGPEGGTGNPDSGLPPPDGGYGPGWTLGTGTCSNSSCGIDCPPNTSLCSDKLCWDTKYAHDNCGACGNACAPAEHCNNGKCCGYGLTNCSNTCVNLQADKQNCGACGNVCSGGTPSCIGGVCKSGPPPVTFTASFPGTPSVICSQFQTFMSQLGSGYSTMTLSGSADPIGVTCNIPAQVDAFAAALKNISSYTTVSCNGHVWSNCARTGPTHDEIWIDPPAQCDLNNCPNPGRILRACFGSAGYSALQGKTCGAVAQTITLTFQ